MTNIMNNGVLIAKIDRVANRVYTVMSEVDLIKTVTEMYHKGNRYEAASVLEAIRKGGYEVRQMKKLPDIHSENFVA